MLDYRKAVNAPDFPPGLDWLNVSRALKMRDLRGKVILLDFWTYCCINCLHVLPEIKKLEEKYRDELVVVGVHSAKFTAERVTENIKQAIKRYEIEHPVVNDYDMIMWRSYGVRAWPTLVLIDTAGKVAGSMAGEGIFDTFDGFISSLIKSAEAEGTLDRTPLAEKIELQQPDTPLSFPGKVLAHEQTRRLYIADTNHNRIVIASLDGSTVFDSVGSGHPGMTDGAYDEASFHHPQGMSIDGHLLYIADTDNHLIRMVDLDERTVSTLAGTGKQARQFNMSGEARHTPMNSPWDVLAHDDALYIAMAGAHQIWRMDLGTAEIEPFAGSGREGRSDGTLAKSTLAQPSGLTTDGEQLYVADSEVSCIRSVEIDPLGHVETIAGGDLFDFGDRDAGGLDTRLQHPLGVVHYEGFLYVADTYNNKIKRIDLSDRTTKTFAGNGERGLKDGTKARLYEPSGVSVAFGKLYIADTNNHVIRSADLETGKVETLKIREAEITATTRPEEVVEVRTQSVAPGSATLTIDLGIPDNLHVNEAAPSSITLTSADSSNLLVSGDITQTIENPQFPLKVELVTREGETELFVDFAIYYCSDELPEIAEEEVEEEEKPVDPEEGLCFVQQGRLRLPVRVAEGELNHKLHASFELLLPAELAKKE